MEGSATGLISLLAQNHVVMEFKLAPESVINLHLHMEELIVMGILFKQTRAKLLIAQLMENGVNGNHLVHVARHVVLQSDQKKDLVITQNQNMVVSHA